jgi:hypothetical protein
MPATEAQKRAMKKWRTAHNEHYLAKQKEYQKKYYDEHKEEILQHKKDFYLTVLKPKREALKNEFVELPETITYKPKIAGGLILPYPSLV